MVSLIKKLSELKDKATSQIKPTLGKALMAAVAISALSVGTANAAASDTELTTVYYVYMNDEFLGTINNKEMIEKLVEEKTDAAKLVYKDLDVTLGPDLAFVPEQVFESAVSSDEADIAKQVESKLSIMAKATAINIDGKAAAYVKDQAAFKEVIRQMKLSYVTEKELADLEQRKKLKPASLPELKENESRLLDVKLTKNMAASTEEVAPNRVLSAEDAVKLLKKGTLEEKKYKVQEGDVLGSIANSHGLELAELLKLNPGLTEDSLLKQGQEMNVTVLKPLVEVAVEKEVFQNESIPFSREVEEDSSMPKGDSRVKQAGKDGAKSVIYKVSEVNGGTARKETVKTIVNEEPVSEITIKGTKEIPSRGSGALIWPASGGYVSSEQGYRWGRMHKGIDIARPGDRTIKAADNGIVVSAGMDGSYGNKVVIDHQNGFRTVYAHLDSISVSSGQTVEAGSQIGVMGSTGDSTGVHLHFEVYKNGQLVNPREYIR
ncbi:M23 family metallopeptidase [Mesobacillus zeae]|uniref:LysM peptidoglycan-binding domain-containing protein n=1 Tax=Mesobacillus zeae TaxID=1917180 RepID=A0A398B9S8_9BACI|nr:M23 family metallopeptidase [Mesobacillus zeae]RID86612.1 LysM peptidoglycan-binding domain-containing protein [Mesobacillus zeae]